MAFTPGSGFGLGGAWDDRWDLFDLQMSMDYTGWVPEGNDVIKFSVIDPPDDRYIPGYSLVEADGDKKTVGPRLKDLNIPFSLYEIGRASCRERVYVLV